MICSPPLELTAEDEARPTGAMRLVGNGQPVPEGFGAGIEVWCGPRGWRSLGDVLGTSVAWHKGRLLVGITWDAGPAPMRVPAAEREEPSPPEL